MQTPSWLVVLAAVVLALPFGWGLGVLAATIVAGPDFGQLLALTVSIAIVVAVVFALLPIVRPGTRLAIMAGGTALFVVLAALTG